MELHAAQNTKDRRFARDHAAAMERMKAGKSGPLLEPSGKLGRVAAERIIADPALPRWRRRSSYGLTALLAFDRIVVETVAAFSERTRSLLNGQAGVPTVKPNCPTR